ncbi:hypothetical protein [Vibrio phage phiKT1028]|nr:hypothetical protein [Vibrio phage phiKT1028]
MSVDYNLGYDVNLDCAHTHINFIVGKDSAWVHEGKIIRTLEAGWVHQNGFPDDPYNQVIDEFLDAITGKEVRIIDVGLDHQQEFKDMIRPLMESVKNHQNDYVNKQIRNDLYNFRFNSQFNKTLN